jgi:hypothetical protein
MKNELLQHQINHYSARLDQAMSKEVRDDKEVSFLRKELTRLKRISRENNSHHSFPAVGRGRTAPVYNRFNPSLN